MPYLLLPIGIDEWVEQGVAHTKQPQVPFQHWVEVALLAGHLHNASDKERGPGQSEAANENGHSADSLEVTGGPWGPVSPGWGSCMLCLADLLAVHGSNLEYVTVEEDKEEQGWEEANAGEGQHEARVKHSEEAAGPLVGGLLEYADPEWEEANEVRHQPQPGNAGPGHEPVHDLEIAEGLLDGKVPVKGNQHDREDRGSCRRSDKCHLKAAQGLLCGPSRAGELVCD